MFDTTLEDLQLKQKQINSKLHSLNDQKRKAMDERIRELASQINDQSAQRYTRTLCRQFSQFADESKGSFEQFKAKIKSLYRVIYQGARELDSRKKQLISNINEQKPLDE